MHNVHYQLNLMRLAREAIIEDRYPQFVKDFFSKLYSGEKEKLPRWAVDALRSVGVDLLSD
jgi:queuine/archaeosine tRNA-ribosyltransferase